MRALCCVLALNLLGACGAKLAQPPVDQSTRAPSLVETSAKLAGRWVREHAVASTATIALDGTWRDVRAGDDASGRLFYWSIFPGSHPPFGERITFKRDALYVELKNANEPLQPSDFFELTALSVDGFSLLALGGSQFAVGERLVYSRPKREAT